MTKVSGPTGAPELQTGETESTTGPPPAPEVESKGFLESIGSSTAETFATVTGADTFIDTVTGAADIALEGLKLAVGEGAAEATTEFFVEGKFHDYTLNPSPAIERVVAGANETLKKYGGEDPIQITAKPDLKDLLYTKDVLSGAAGKLDQIPMAAAALTVGVLHENRAITQAITESDIFQAIKENAGTILQGSTALTLMSLTGMPSGLAVKATQAFKDSMDGAFDTLDQSLKQIRDQPLLARENAVGMTLPLRQRLERMPVGDSCEKKFKLSAEIHEGLGVKLGSEISGDVKKLGENKYEVTLKGKGELFVGFGVSAQTKGLTGDVLAKHQVEIKIEVEGKDAAKIIDSGGDLTSLLTLTNPAVAANAVSKAAKISPDEVTMKMTSCDIKFERGSEVNFGVLKQQLTAELSSKTGVALQGTYELELKKELPIHINGLSAEQGRSLQDCLKAMIEPTNTKSLKAEGKIRFDGALSAEFKLEIESGDNKMEAKIKLAIKDPAKVAAHLNVSEAALNEISPQVLFDQLGSLPSDAVEVSMTLTGHETYLGAKLAIPPATYSMANSHPTEFIKIPNPNMPNQNLSAQLTEAKRQIVALSEGWNNERPVALKA